MINSLFVSCVLFISSCSSLQNTIPRMPDVHYMSLCAKKPGSKECVPFEPIAGKVNLLPTLEAQQVYTLNTEEPKFRQFGKQSQFVPYNCYLTKLGEAPTNRTAFIIGGDTMGDSVTIFYKRYSSAIVEFHLASLMETAGRQYYDSYYNLYSIQCSIAECSGTKSIGNETCPDFTQLLDWHPKRENMFAATLKGVFRVRNTPKITKTRPYRNINVL